MNTEPHSPDRVVGATPSPPFPQTFRWGRVFQKIHRISGKLNIPVAVPREKPIKHATCTGLVESLPGEHGFHLSARNRDFGGG